MTKICPKCLHQNNDTSFWCAGCNTKLQETIIPNPSFEEQYGKQQQSPSRSYQQEFKQSLSKKQCVLAFLIPILIGICIIAVLFFFGTFTPVSLSESCKINEDFFFENNSIITADGWHFTITVVKPYQLEGIVLDMHTYSKNDFPYRPINTFSPIDLVIGVQDILTNPNSYPYQITSFSDRYVWWEFHGTNQNDLNYFKTHTGNNHIIPHNTEVINVLETITVGDHINLDGYLVDLYGTKGNMYYTWETDTEIGNFDCEIILVDNLIVQKEIPPPMI